MHSPDFGLRIEVELSTGSEVSNTVMSGVACRELSPGVRRVGMGLPSSWKGSTKSTCKSGRVENGAGLLTSVGNLGS